MLLLPFRWALSALTTVVLLYVFFFVPIGQRTLFDHVKRIVSTPEAADLGRDVRTAGERVVDRARTELQQGLYARDAGDVRVGPIGAGPGELSPPAVPHPERPAPRRRP